MGLFTRKKPKEQVEYNELIFCPSGSREEILSTLEQTFGLEHSAGGNQITLTQGDLMVAFLVQTARDEGEDGKYAQEQLQGAWHYFRDVKTEQVEVQRNVLHHLRRCQGLIRIYAVYHGLENGEKEDAIWSQIWRAALAVQGLVTRGMDTLCSASGQPIFDRQGHSELSFYMPPACPLPEEWRERNPQGCARRERSVKTLEEKNIYAMSCLPLLWEDEEKEGRTLREVCGRASALLVVALYSECRLGDKMSHEEAREFIKPIIEAYGAEEFFSPDEQDYLHDPDNSQEQQVQFVWQYENLWVVEWALGLNDDLFWPNRICDVPGSVRLMQEYPDMNALLSAARLRSRKELLDQADLSYLLHWACVEARISGLSAPQGIDEGVVMERHHALFWLAGCDSCCGWDEVELST